MLHGEIFGATPTEIAEMVKEGKIPLESGLEAVLAQGHLLIGTAVRKPSHSPVVPMNGSSGVWRPVATSEAGADRPNILRATRVASTAILCGVMGDCNITGQRALEGIPIVQTDRHILHGWRVDPDAQSGYRNQIDREAYQVIARNPDSVGGWIDAVPDGGSWTELDGQNSNTGAEPNHYFTKTEQTTIASFPVSGLHLLRLSNVELIH